MIKWLIHLLGGKTKSEYEKLKEDYRKLYNDLELEYRSLEKRFNSYASVNFEGDKEYSFSVKSNSPYEILISKGTNVTVTGYKGEELVDKLNIREQ